MTRPLNLTALHRDDALLDRIGRGDLDESSPGLDSDEVTLLLVGWRADIVGAVTDGSEVPSTEEAAPNLTGVAARRRVRPAIVGLILAGALASAGGAAAATVQAEHGGMFWSAPPPAARHHSLGVTAPPRTTTGPDPSGSRTAPRSIPTAAGALPSPLGRLINTSAAPIVPRPVAEPPNRSAGDQRAARNARRPGSPGLHGGHRARPPRRLAVPPIRPGRHIPPAPVPPQPFDRPLEAAAMGPRMAALRAPVTHPHRRGSHHGSKWWHRGVHDGSVAGSWDAVSWNAASWDAVSWTAGH